MTPPTKWQAQQMGWQEAIKQDEDSYNHVVNLAREAIKELENRQFIKEGQNVATFLDPSDEIIEDDLEMTMKRKILHSLRYNACSASSKADGERAGATGRGETGSQCCYAP
jgi:phosphoenolpyruvate-protein kinase (PTS system EI component)